MRLLNASTYLLAILSVYTWPAVAADLPTEDTNSAATNKIHESLSLSPHHTQAIASNTNNNGPDDIIGRIRGVKRRLLRNNGGPTPDTHAIQHAIQSEVRDISKTYTEWMKTFRQQIKDEDREGILSMIKSSTTNSQYFIDTIKERVPDSEESKEDTINLISQFSDYDIESVNDMPTSDLVKSFSPMLDILDEVIDTSDNVNSIFDKYSNDQRRLVSSNSNPKCQPECSFSDETCTCYKLARCAKNITQYDLAVLMTKGYIDIKPTSENFANFTVDDGYLKEFYNVIAVYANYSRGNNPTGGLQGDTNKVPNIVEKWNSIQKAANDALTFDCSAVPLDSETIGLLREFATACPPGQSCTNKEDINDDILAADNSQAVTTLPGKGPETYQLTVDEVCAAVNTDVKLKSSAILNSLDPTPSTKDCNLASYGSCAGAIRTFDRLYNARDKTTFPDWNPLRLDINQDVSTIAGNKVYEYTQFPTSYKFEMDSQGVKTLAAYDCSEFRSEQVQCRYDLAERFTNKETSPNSECYAGLSEFLVGNETMTNCDVSFSLLLGQSTSFGTLASIEKNFVIYGLPGSCCLDNAATTISPGDEFQSSHFGFNHDSSKNMTCEKSGPFHLGISRESCENAKGRWTRGPCKELKACVSDYPKKGDPGYNANFDAYVRRRLSISDAGDQKQCNNTRAALGFSQDYPLDNEVCDAFYKLLCEQEASNNTTATSEVVNYNKPVPPDVPKLEPYTQLGALPAHTYLDDLLLIDEVKVFKVATQVLWDAYQTAIALVRDFQILGPELAEAAFTANTVALAMLVVWDLSSIALVSLEVNLFNYPKDNNNIFKELTPWLANTLNAIHGDAYGQRVEMRKDLIDLGEWTYYSIIDHTTCLTNYLINGLSGSNVTSCEVPLLPQDIFTDPPPAPSNVELVEWTFNTSIFDRISSMEKQMSSMEKQLTTALDTINQNVYKQNVEMRKDLINLGEWTYYSIIDHTTCLTNYIINGLSGSNVTSCEVPLLPSDLFTNPTPIAPSNVELVKTNTSIYDRISSIEKQMKSSHEEIINNQENMEKQVKTIAASIGKKVKAKCSKKPFRHRNLLDIDEVVVDDDDELDSGVVEVIKREVAVLKDEVVTMNEEVKMAMKEEVTVLKDLISQLIEQNKATIDQNKELIEQNKELMAKVSASA